MSRQRMMILEDTIEYLHVPSWRVANSTDAARRFLSVND
jgi:hypothetical protein